MTEKTMEPKPANRTTETVVDLFRHVAAEHGAAVAIERGENRIRYADLENRSNQVAHRLNSASISRGSLVAIVAEDPINVVTAMLGVLKAGAVYVPLDPSFPRQRLMTMVAHVQPVCFLASPQNSALVRSLCETGNAHAIWLDQLETEPQDMELSKQVSDDEAASSIYFTSGSTGRPKAILGRLRGIDDFVRWEIETLGIGAGTRVSQLASPSFDGFLKDVFVPLCAGGTVCAPESRRVVLEAGRLADWVDVEGIEVLQCVPSVFRSLLNQKLDANYFSALKWVVLAGEALLPADVRRWMEVFGDRVKLLNLYGPTETTITKLYYVVQPEDIARPSIPIGKPMRGSAVMVLNAARKPCRTGVAGEIYIRTPYRALGYYKDPELTGQVFLKNPFRDDPEDIVYRTGDYGRLLEDGNLEFLGRKDDQVKIRGVRVELGEIENVLRGHGGVRDVAVVDREDGGGNKFLCAYVVLSGEVQGGELREYSAERLPEAMVPSAFVEMQELPRTLNGKIDRKALPALEQARRRRESRPATPVEEIIAGVWGEVLQLQQVGGEENFFELGGHSLLATQVVSRVRASLGVQVPLRALFEAPTVAGMARYVEQNIDTAREQPLAPIRKRDRSENLPLSYAQQRLWFLDQVSGNGTSYLMSVVVRLRGELNVAVLEQSVGEVVRRHEVLRTRLPAREGQPVQVVEEAGVWRLRLMDLSRLEQSEAEAEAGRIVEQQQKQPFDLERGPLLRTLLVRLGHGDHLLVCHMHHLLADGWSFGILTEEVSRLYASYREGRPSDLPELAIQYGDFVLWEREWLSGEVLESRLKYWRERLEGGQVHLQLPQQRLRPAVQSFRGMRQQVRLSAELAERVRGFSRREGTTLFMTMLSGFLALLYQYTGQEDLVVGSVIANRERAEVEKLIGFLANTLVLRVDVSGEPSFRQLLERVRETCLQAYAQQLPPEKLQRGGDRQPLYEVWFQLESRRRQILNLPGLEWTRLGQEFSNDQRVATRFELSLVLREGEDGITGEFEYDSDLFDHETITQMSLRFSALVEHMLATPEARIAEVGLASQQETEALIGAFSASLDRPA